MIETQATRDRREAQERHMRDARAQRHAEKRGITIAPATPPVVGEAKATVAFDKNAYMREYMAKRRTVAELTRLAERLEAQAAELTSLALLIHALTAPELDSPTAAHSPRKQARSSQPAPSPKQRGVRRAS